MKFLITLSLLGLSFQSFGADSDKKINYKHCQAAFNVPTQLQGPRKDFPFKMKDNGKIEVHKDANYSYDEETKTETIKYEIGKGEGFGMGSDLSVVIKRDGKGVPTQVIYNTAFKGVKTKTGLGAKNQGWGAGMYGAPGIGIGGGFGYGGGFNAGPSKSSFC